tara:strand:- start:5069 stop:6616 length:1548 start_codon:yes stop_codon:yes gene_type:complete
MSALIVNNVLSSSLEVNYNYLDTEELFGYQIQGSYVIDISDIEFQQDDTVLLVGRDAIKEAYGRPNIVARIGADDYLNGRISDISFDAGTLVGSETVTVTIAENRKLDDYSSSEFAKYIPNPHALESFSESYNFSRNGANYSSSRDISISYNQEAGDQFLDNAKTFLTNYYFTNRPDLGYQEDGISENAKINKNFKGYLSETYDLINLSVSLNEKVDSSIIDPNQSVSTKETQTIQLTERGFLEKTVNVELTSLKEEVEKTLTSAIAQKIQEIKTKEQAEFGSPFSISKGIIKDSIRATLTLVFSTDPSKSGDNNISYSGVEAKANKFKEYTLNITFNSNGKNNVDKFDNCKNFWNETQDDNPLRVRRLFHPTEAFHEKSRRSNFNRAEGSIQDSIVYTTDPAYATTDSNLLKLKKTLSKERQINRIEKFLDLSNLEEQVVVSDLKTVGRASVTAEATVSQGAGIYEAQRILESKTQEFTDFVDEDVTHIVADVCNTNIGDGKATRNLTYLFLSD